jgi:hypothetical protein
MIKLITLLACLLTGASTKPMLGQLPDWSKFPQPIGLWLINEFSGPTINDLSGNGYTGTFVADTHWISGKFGPCLDFDGSGDYVDLTAVSGLSVSGEWSISAWLKNDNTTADSAIICQALASSDRLIVGYDTSLGSIQANVYNGSWAGKSFDYNNNEWHHIVFINKAGTVTGYFDGAPMAGNDLGIYANTSIKLVFGGRDDHWESNDFNGQISNVTAFNFGLSGQQAAKLYQDPFPWFERGPIELWESTTAEPSGGQIIFINSASMKYGILGFGLVLAFALIKKLRE